MGSSPITHTALMAIRGSLTPPRQQSVKKITSELVYLGLPKETVDAVLAAVILEAAEAQYVSDGGAVPPPRESSVSILRNLFSKKKPSQGTNEEN